MTLVSALSNLEWAIRFLLIPIAIIALIWFLWALAGWMRRSASRPGQPWTGDPLWVNAPADGTPAALVPAGAGPDDRGGASARW